MARLRTLAEIRAQAKEQADMTHSGFISDATWNLWINQAYAELVDLLVEANPDWYLADVAISTTKGEPEYELPVDFYEVRGVDWEISADHRVSLQPFNFLARNRHSDTWPPPRWNSEAATVRYRVIRKGIDGSLTRIRFEGDPGNRTYRVWYVTTAERLEGDEDELDGVNGWEDFIVYTCAAQALQKEESDASVVLMRRAEIKSRIESMARRRHAGQPVQVADLRR